MKRKKPHHRLETKSTSLWKYIYIISAELEEAAENLSLSR